LLIILWPAHHRKLTRQLPDFLSVEEIERLINTPDISTPQGQIDRAILEFLYDAGLRVSELVQLKLEQVNLEGREVRVWGKGSKERVALIGKHAVKH
jgi:integrase/recombinase XerC